MADFNATIIDEGTTSFGPGDSAAALIIYTSGPPEPLPIPPIVGAFTPAGGSITTVDTIDFDVTDADTLDADLSIRVYAEGPDSTEVVYDTLTGFAAPYTGTVTPIVDGFSFTNVGRTGGWNVTPLTLTVFVRDDSGLEDSGSETYTVTGIAPPIPPPDATPPVVSNLSPAAGSQLARAQGISFDVTDNLGDFARIFVVAWFKATGVQEVIHDGDGFVGYYSAVSSRVPISGGFRYTVARSGGWSSAPTIRVYPIDGAGNQP